MAVQIQRCLALVLLSSAVFSKTNIEKQQLVFARTFGKDILNIIDVVREQRNREDSEIVECVETLFKMKNTVPGTKRKLTSAEREACESVAQMHNGVANAAPAGVQKNNKKPKIPANAPAGVENHPVPVAETSSSSSNAVPPTSATSRPNACANGSNASESNREDVTTSTTMQSPPRSLPQGNTIAREDKYDVQSDHWDSDLLRLVVLRTSETDEKEEEDEKEEVGGVGVVGDDGGALEEDENITAGPAGVRATDAFKGGRVQNAIGETRGYGGGYGHLLVPDTWGPYAAGRDGAANAGAGLVHMGAGVGVTARAGASSDGSGQFAGGAAPAAGPNGTNSNGTGAGLVLAGGGQGQVTGNAAAAGPNGNTANPSNNQAGTIIMTPDGGITTPDIDRIFYFGGVNIPALVPQQRTGGRWTKIEQRQLEAVVHAAKIAVTLKEAGRECPWKADDSRRPTPLSADHLYKQSRDSLFWEAVEREFNICMHATNNHHATVNQSRMLPNYRTKQDCRNRWKTHDPAILKGPWTAEENEVLREVYFEVTARHSLHRKGCYQNFEGYTHLVIKPFLEKTKRHDGTHRTTLDIIKQVRNLQLYEEFVRKEDDSTK